MASNFASTSYNEADMPPPSYNEVMGKMSGNPTVANELTFVDFLPRCLNSGGIFAKPIYESFKVLIDQANIWLQSNHKWEVRTCESVEFKCRGEFVSIEKMTYLERRDAHTSYIRGLRLWVVPRVHFDRGIQRISYMNFVPQRVGDAAVFSMPSFESLDDVLKRFNNWVHHHPGIGQIINIESQEMKLRSDYELDPDQCCWREKGSIYKHYLFVIRIFFAEWPGVKEEIGIQDFIPSQISSGGMFSHPKYEPFSNVVRSASAWAHQQNGTLRICNVQSLEIKIKSAQGLNTQKMSYTEHGERSTHYVRILRLSFTKPTADSCLKEYRTVSNLTCKTFVPIQLSTGILMPEFEGLIKTKARVEAWIKATGADVISAETCAMRLFTGGEAYSGIETSFTYNVAEKHEHWIFIIRVYLNGVYQEPQRSALPDVPEIQDECCTVS